MSHEERLGGGSRCGSCGGAEASKHLQMQPHNEIYSSECQEQPQMVNGLRKLKFQSHVMRNLSKNLYIFFFIHFKAIVFLCMISLSTLSVR